MRRRSISTAILSIVVLILTLLAPAATAAKSTPNVTQQVNALIQKYGPVLVLHPQEKYLLDAPGAVLLGSATLNWGLVHTTDNPATLSFDQVHSVKTSPWTILRDQARAMQDPNASNPDFEIWLDTDSRAWSGHPLLASSYVMVSNPGGDQNTLDIQFWFYYAYNGPVKAQVTIPVAGVNASVSLDQVGRHEGDWEQVILRFNRANSSSSWTLQKLFLSQHSGGQWLLANDASLTYRGTHPVIYSALDSHANYATIGSHQSAETIVNTTIPPGIPIVAYQLDFTGAGRTFASYFPWNYQIVSSTVPGMKAPPAPQWFSYEGLWGPYQLHTDTVSLTLPAPYGTISYPVAQVDKGPLGPAQHAPIP